MSYRGDGGGGGRGRGGGGRGRGSGQQPSSSSSYGGGRGGGGGGRGGGGGGRGAGGGRGYSGPATEVLTPDVWLAASAGRLTLQPSHPSSSKSMKPPARPGYGKIGMKCMVRANHFMVDVADRDLHHYDVAITPEVTRKSLCRKIISTLVESNKQYLGKRMPAYDGNKSIYTAGPLPFTLRDFNVNLVEKDGMARPDSKELQFKVTVKLAAKVSLHNLREFLHGKQLDIPQDCIQVLDVVLRAAKPSEGYAVIGRSFFSTTLGKGDLGEGLEYWRGYYQSLRPTQMGLSLIVDASARPFYAPFTVPEFVERYLGKELSMPLSDVDRLKVKKALRGITIRTSYRGYKKNFRITGISTKPMSQEMFPLDTGVQMSVCQYFREKYHIDLSYTFLPCILVGQEKKATCIPMELCTIDAGQRYAKKLTREQVASLLRATCQRPWEREENIKKMLMDNKYNQHQLVNKEFGIKLNESTTAVNARVLPTPMLKYHESGGEARVAPGVGQWNMIGKRMYNGASVTYWTSLNFSRWQTDDVAHFCSDLVKVCNDKGMTINPKPVIPVSSYPPNVIKKALIELHNKAKGRLQLLIIILPDQSGSYGKIKRICETELGIISQCCQPKAAGKGGIQYLENVSLKINVKVGGRNTVLLDAIERRIPMISDRPTIIIGADVTYPSPGEDSMPSIAAVVASMDWPEITKYRGLVSAQGREEIIQDLYKVVQDPVRGLIHGGMIREHLIAFRRSTAQKPDRIIFYRDGVGEGQFAEVLLKEMDAIRKACASLEEGYLPRVTFVVVQKRHHTRLFASDRGMTDRSGNILPGTVVDTQICHPSEFDFYLCSHAGIQGTSRPTHYHVLYDENNFSADVLQLLTYSLCFTYQRCTRSVSIVPPAYYAHLAAFRARYYLEDEAPERESTSGGGGGQDIQWTLPNILDNVKDVMFFC
ncbi:argonaute 5 [Dionaea muscipula]